MKTKNEAEELIDLIMKRFKLDTFSQLAAFLEITQSAINGWIARNSTKTIKKHLRKKNIDPDKIEETTKIYEKEKDETVNLFKEFDFEKSEDTVFKKREAIKKNLELEKEKKLENYKQTLSLLSQTKNGFSKEFQYAFWARFEEIKEAIFEGFNGDYWDDSSTERVWNNQKIDEEFEKLLKSVVEKDNLVILEV